MEHGSGLRRTEELRINLPRSKGTGMETRKIRSFPEPCYTSGFRPTGITAKALGANGRASMVRSNNGFAREL